MLPRIYHGSDHIIECPVFGAGKPYNDYGLGFYCTLEHDMAKEWAARPDRDGFANAYDFDDSGLVTLDLNAERYCVLHWLGVLLETHVRHAVSARRGGARVLVARVLRRLPRRGRYGGLPGG